MTTCQSPDFLCRTYPRAKLTRAKNDSVAECIYLSAERYKAGADVRATRWRRILSVEGLGHLTLVEHMQVSAPITEAGILQLALNERDIFDQTESRIWRLTSF